MSLDRAMHLLHSADGYSLASTCAAYILRFLNGVFIFNTNNCSRSALEKTGGFAHNWPLMRAKFASVFLIFASVWLSHPQFRRILQTKYL
jgi:hypothetical protein